MSEKIEALTNNFLTARKQLRSEVTRDEKQLKLLTDRSNRTIEYLKIVSEKAEQILNLIEICRKFETEEEKVVRWKQEFDKDGVSPEGADEKELEEAEEIVDEEETQKWAESVLEIRTLPKKSDVKPKRPKTSVTRLPSIQQQSEKSGEKFTRQCKLHQKKISPQDSVILNLHNGFTPTLTVGDPHTKSCNVDESIAALCNLEGFWHVNSKIQLDCEVLKKEKSKLAIENKRLKEIMRNVLEAVALEDNAPVLKMVSMHRDISSAPAKYGSSRSRFRVQS